MKRAAIGLVLIACAPEPPAFAHYAVVEQPDYTDAIDSCSWHCARFRYAGLRCPEAFASWNGTDCVTACVREDARKPLPFACWTQANSPAELRACGGIVCER